MTRFAVAFALSLALTAAPAFAAPVPKEVKKQAPKLDGTWEVTEWHSAGNKVNSSITIRWVIEGDKLTIERNNANAKGGGLIKSANVSYSLVKPDGGEGNALDYTITYNTPNGPPARTLPGVVEVDGDTLKFCYTNTVNGTRPAECKPEQTNTLYVFKRVDTGK